MSKPRKQKVEIRDFPAEMEPRQEEELTPEQAAQVKAGSNANFPPGQFPSGGGTTASRLD